MGALNALQNLTIPPLNELPLGLMAGWAAWLTVGLMLLVWSRRAAPSAAPVAPVRAARPKSSVRRPIAVPPPPPIPANGAFDELHALLDRPVDVPQTRRPGEE